jgi:hypothetical protein
MNTNNICIHYILTQTMAPVSSIIPGAAYNSTTQVYTIPVSALNAALLKTFVPNGSFEQLLHSLCTILKERSDAGSLAAYQCAASIDNKSIQSSVYEKTQNVFSNCTLVSMLLSFCFETTAVATESATNMSVIG